MESRRGPAWPSTRGAVVRSLAAITSLLMTEDTEVLSEISCLSLVSGEINVGMTTLATD